MNWLLIVVVLILAACMTEGYYKGLIRMVVSTVSMVVVLWAGTVVTPHMTNFLTQYTGIDERVRETCDSYLQTRIEEKTTELPMAVQGILGVLGENTAEQLIRNSSVYQELVDSVTGSVMRGISYFISVLLITLIALLLAHLLNLLSKLPGIRAANKMAGLLLGVVKGLLLVWLLLYFVSILCAYGTGDGILQQIAESRFLSWLYQNDLFMKLL